MLLLVAAASSASSAGPGRADHGRHGRQVVVGARPADTLGGANPAPGRSGWPRRDHPGLQLDTYLVPAVSPAANGANVVIYLSHGNGWPANTYDQKYDEGRLRAPAHRRRARNLKYCSGPYAGPRLRAGRRRVPASPRYASGNSEPGAWPSQSIARQRVDNYGAAFLAAGASACCLTAGRTSYYLRALFTQTESLIDLWRGAPNYHAHDIVFTPTRSTGTGVMDPDNGGSSPSATTVRSSATSGS